MTSDLPDVEMYHQELLCNLELRRTLRVTLRKRQAALLSDIDPIKEDDNSEDREFTESYVKNCGLAPQR